jgi:hypothetical protein
MFLFFVSFFAATAVVLLFRTFPLIRYIYCRQHFKRYLLGSVCLAGLCVLVYSEEKWRGRTSWMQLKDGTEARVEVDAAQVVRPVDARLFGINTAVWDAILDTPPTVAALRELDIQVLRFGGFSDEYHWASGTVGTNTQPAPTTFLNFLHVATNVHAQAVITVNYGSGTPEEAAAWVRCANVTNGCAFKYWRSVTRIMEVGNTTKIRRRTIRLRMPGARRNTLTK